MAFDSCKSLKSLTLSEDLVSIGEHAFYGCESLEAVEIPSCVSIIGPSSFGRCINLSEIIVDSDNAVFNSRGNCNAIIETGTNTLVVGCKNTVIPDGVKSIGDSAFHYCTGLTSIKLPDSVTLIDDYAFFVCENLESVNIPDGVTRIGEMAFANCDSLKILVFPESVTSIGSYAFDRSTNDGLCIYVYKDSFAHELAQMIQTKHVVIGVDVYIGDVNGDLDIAIMDATEIQLFIAQLTELSDNGLVCADAYKDGDITIMDATQIQLFIAQLIPEL